MFPNDDICNVDAARLAAQRLFRRYRGGDNKEQPSMGKIEVNKLMKATYEAINMRIHCLIELTIRTKRTFFHLSVCSIRTKMGK
jgi:hypothetical protein